MLLVEFFSDQGFGIYIRDLYPSYMLKKRLVQKSLERFILAIFDYRKVASSNTSRLEAHSGFFTLLMKGIFDLYTLYNVILRIARNFLETWENIKIWLVAHSRTVYEGEI